MHSVRKAAFAAAMAGVVASAQAGVDYQDEYDKKIKAAQNIGALGDDLAGDRVNYYTGATSFSVVDISVPTNGLPLKLGRKRSVSWDNMLSSTPGDPYHREIIGSRSHDFLDWELDVPSISTVMTQGAGWIVDGSYPLKRCGVIGQLKADGKPANGAPPDARAADSTSPSFRTFNPNTYWNGYSMNVPGGEQTLLLADQPNAERPTAGGPYHWTTNQDWWLSCVPAQNDQGEGFLAISPDGTKYRFDWMSSSDVYSTTDRGERDPNSYGWTYKFYIFKAEYKLLATRVEDRFGNWLAYDWTSDRQAQLRSIKAGHASSTVPDQQITLQYDPVTKLVSSATDGSHTWRYAYFDEQLYQVKLPDTSTWEYEFSALGQYAPPSPYCDTEIAPGSPDYYWACFGGGEVAASPISVRVKHPSGANIDFTFENHFQYGLNGHSHPLGLVSKTVSGPGIAPATWRFGYLPSKTEIRDACRASNCPKRLMTDVLAPDGSLVRRIFGAVPLQNETVLLGELRGSNGANGGGSPPITSSPRWGTDILDDVSPLTGAVPLFYSESDYRRIPEGQAMPYTVRVGSNPMLDVRFQAVQVFETERRLPTSAKYLRQQGVTFATETTSFDGFARPLEVTRSNTGAAGGDKSLRESTTYVDDRAKWVLGLPGRKAVDGIEVSRSVYDPISLLPVRNYAYGFPQEAVAYNPDGTVASVTDGRGNVTRVSEWKAGIPQRISYPTGFFERAEVGPTGTIDATINESGVRTAYTYDDMDRLKRIKYPTGDSQAWNDTVRTFSFVATDQMNIRGSHWVSTVQTGNGLTTTYYDARLQPVATTTEDVSVPGSKTVVWKRFDGLGREVFTSYPQDGSVGWAQSGTTTQYDALGRPRQVTQESELGLLVNTTEYLTGFITRVTNPRGFKTSTRYQVYDAPSTDFPIQIDAPQGQQTVIVRDVFGKPLTINRNGPGGS
jgi:YD repeat-containing protein